MKQDVQDILRAAGIAVRDDNVYATMENWLGMNDTTYDGLTVEDCAPLDESVYLKAVQWLQNVWDPSSSSSASSSSSSPTDGASFANLFLESKLPPDTISLDQVFASVRATRWLRCWMDLSVDDNGAVSFTECLLLRHLSRPEQRTMLLKALYHHIQELPVLQSQIHLYTQSLQRGDNSNVATAIKKSGTTALGSSGSSSSRTTMMSDPKARLEQYANAMQVSNRLQTEWQQHIDRLEVIVGEWYRIGDADIRKTCRRLLGQVWMTYVLQSGSAGVRQENTRAAGIRMTLNVLHRILLGVAEIEKSHEHLLFQQLVPLHKPDAMVLWRDQTSVLELYHEPLTKCIAVILQKQPSLIPSTIQAILHSDVFPSMGNTPKQVLLLHEIDTYLGIGLPQDADAGGAAEKTKENASSLATLFAVLVRCITSDNSRVAERALEFFRNKEFVRLVHDNFASSLQTLLPALVRREPSWNPTVRKMTFHVLKQLQEHDGETFARISNQIFTDVAGKVSSSTPPAQEKIATKQSSSIISTTNSRMDPSAPKDASLKAGMGDWKPPSSRRSLGGSMPPPSARLPSSKSKAPPPLTVTGVAPWASATPPLTVTGVAPWAMQPPAAAASGPAVTHKRRAQEAQLGGITEVQSNNSSIEQADSTGLAYVEAYMKKIKPPEEEEGASSWSKLQMAETPTLLPKLKFHDLVFGHELGTGTFGSVKYARLIDRSKTRSHWPEYAVKIISTEKIRELGYESSVQREIAILRILSHPNIARLVSSFRFREGAYLVLEYASGGDLHALLRKHGSLDHDSTRFVIGEVVAALASIHDLGFVYSDLKAENILITEPGHIKLTDFGGCRPVTGEAREMVRSIGKGILANLRDGDWKPKQGNESNAVDEEIVMADDEEDARIEGTTSYLPPEVVMGAIPTIAADAWALGCVTYQCLSGRPPFLEEDDAATRRRIVSFEVQQESTNEVDRIFEDKHASGIESSARDMIKSLLQRTPSSRPDMHQVARCSFFTQANVDVFSLHQQPAYSLDVGNVAPAPDAQWSRRQFSSIWAPQPEAYNISFPDDEDTYSTSFGIISTSAPILEGEEASGFFSPSGKLPQQLGKISERLPTRTQ